MSIARYNFPNHNANRDLNSNRFVILVHIVTATLVYARILVNGRLSSMPSRNGRPIQCCIHIVRNSEVQPLVVQVHIVIKKGRRKSYCVATEVHSCSAYTLGGPRWHWKKSVAQVEFDSRVQ